LWKNCPVLTIKGDRLCRRVGASLLKALGLQDELVTRNLKEYEKRAIYLATHPEELKKIRKKLNLHKETYPLFDTELYVRNLEKAFDLMWENYLTGKKPKNLVV
jgi:predicted O-linked N-acetylglucosamine transferase (SPINDLY family)